MSYSSEYLTAVCTLYFGVRSFFLAFKTCCCRRTHIAATHACTMNYYETADAALLFRTTRQTQYADRKDDQRTAAARTLSLSTPCSVGQPTVNRPNDARRVRVWLLDFGCPAEYGPHSHIRLKTNDRAARNYNTATHCIFCSSTQL